MWAFQFKLVSNYEYPKNHTILHTHKTIKYKFFSFAQTFTEPINVKQISFSNKIRHLGKIYDYDMDEKFDFI